MFDIHAIEKGASSDKIIVLTFQGMTEEDLEGWVSVMEGQINVSRPQISSKTEMQSRFKFIKKFRIFFIYL
jgi:hypothetical protein